MIPESQDRSIEGRRYLDTVSQEVFRVTGTDKFGVVLRYEYDDGIVLLTWTSWRDMIQNQLFKEII